MYYRLRIWNPGDELTEKQLEHRVNEYATRSGLDVKVDEIIDCEGLTPEGDGGWVVWTTWGLVPTTAESADSFATAVSFMNNIGACTVEFSPVPRDDRTR